MQELAHWLAEASLPSVASPKAGLGGYIARTARSGNSASHSKRPTGSQVGADIAMVAAGLASTISPA